MGVNGARAGRAPALLRGLAIGLIGVLGLAVGGCAAPTAGRADRTAASPSPATAPAPAGQSDVPLTLEGRTPRLVAHVEIGGADLRVVVDTGSSGLRVVATKVPPTVAVVDGPARPYGYASGLLLHGRLAHAPARLGAASSPAMPLELVDTTGCTPARPGCNAGGGQTPDLMGGRFDGILGISPAGGPGPPNPLWSLGALGHAYTLHVDPAAASSLVLGTPADGFVVARLAPARRPADDEGADAPPRWQPRTPICVRAAFLPGGSACLPTLFDTGTPPLANVYVPGAGSASATPGSTVTFTTPDGRWSTSAISERGRGATIPPSGLPANSGTTIVGLPLFDRTDVRFDLAAGTLGLRAR